MFMHLPGSGEFFNRVPEQALDPQYYEARKQLFSTLSASRPRAQSTIMHHVGELLQASIDTSTTTNRPFRLHEALTDDPGLYDEHASPFRRVAARHDLLSGLCVALLVHENATLPPREKADFIERAVDWSRMNEADYMTSGETTYYDAPRRIRRAIEQKIAATYTHPIEQGLVHLVETATLLGQHAAQVSDQESVQATEVATQYRQRARQAITVADTTRIIGDKRALSLRWQLNMGYLGRNRANPLLYPE